MRPPSPRRTRPSPGDRRRRRKRASKRGVALIMVMAAITILTVMHADIQDEATSDLSAALADSDCLRAEYIARSGINLSRLLIAAEPTIRGAIAPLFMMMRVTPPQIPVWEFSDRVLGAFNDKTGAEEFTALAGVNLAEGKNLGIEGGKFEVVIVDEDSKLNVNIAARGDAFSEIRLASQLMGIMTGDQYNKLFEERDRDEQYSDRFAICSAVVDWADPEENLFNCDLKNPASGSSVGSEDSFYQMLKNPYKRKNAAFDSLEELRFVRGFGEDFWATFVDPDPGDPKKRLMTVWGQGAVNVNTANAQTLVAIICGPSGAPQSTLCMDPAQMSGFLMGLTMVKGFTMGAPLFSSAKDFIRTLGGKGKNIIVQLLPFLIPGFEPIQLMSESDTEKMITTESKVFSIYADGVVPGFRRETRVRIHTVVDFRQAPAPAYAQSPDQMPPGPQQGAGSRAGMPSGKQKDADSQASQDAITGAMVPNPGGTMIYYRVE